MIKRYYKHNNKRNALAFNEYMVISNKYETYGVDLEKASPTEKENMIKPQDIALSFIKSAVNQKYQKGLPNDKLRMFSNIEDKFASAIKEDTEEVGINEYELLFIKEAYRDAVFAPQQAKAAVAVYDMLFPQ